VVEPVIPLTPYGIDDVLSDGCFLPRLRDKKNLIIQGPPGTGKTWLSRRRGMALVDMAFRRRFAFLDLEPSLGTAWREWVVGTMQLEATAPE
jgi:5-methylcytosine-specific restriction protein B